MSKKPVMPKKLPSGGGSYLAEKNGGLNQVERTLEAGSNPVQKPVEDTAEKPAEAKGE
ncbi:MAG: hypothetical protein QM488_18540 [Rhizobiaceae bacterium]